MQPLTPFYTSPPLGLPLSRPRRRHLPPPLSHTHGRPQGIARPQPHYSSSPHAPPVNWHRYPLLSSTAPPHRAITPTPSSPNHTSCCLPLSLTPIIYVHSGNFVSCYANPRAATAAQAREPVSCQANPQMANPTRAYGPSGAQTTCWSTLTPLDVVAAKEGAAGEDATEGGGDRSPKG